MSFISNFDDGRIDRVYLHIFGAPKIGKTTAVLDLVEHSRDFVILISMDRGHRMRVAQNPALFNKRLAVATPSTLQELREDLRVAKFKVDKAASQGVDRRRIWVCLDTITHTQILLMSEARKINVKNPSSQDRRDEYIRDATTEVDYMVNLGHMSEVADTMVSMPCNSIVLALEKEQSVQRKKTGVMIPAISGQSFTRFMGDADAILRIRADHGERVIEPFVDGELTGDRSGNLAPEEPMDLKRIQQKMLGVSAEKKSLEQDTQQDETGQATA